MLTLNSSPLRCNVKRGESPQPRSPNVALLSSLQSSVASGQSSSLMMPGRLSTSMSPKNKSSALLTRGVLNEISQIHEMTRKQLEDLIANFAGGGDANLSETSDERALRGIMDELSGADARRLAVELYMLLRSSLQKSQSALQAAAVQERAYFPQAYLNGAVAVPPATPSSIHQEESFRTALMKPSFIRAPLPPDDAQAQSSNSGPVPPLSALASVPSISGPAAVEADTHGSPFPSFHVGRDHSPSVVALAPRTVPSAVATPTLPGDKEYLFHFKPKNRRESVESFASQAIVSRRSIRNTTSIERSVDPEGFKTINDYTILRDLGRGASGKVKLAVHHETGELRAVKVVKRPLMKKLQGPNGLERLKKEVAIMKKLNHKHIIQLFEVIDDPESEKMYFVMQFAELGEVMPGWSADHSPSSEVTPLEPNDAARILRQAASGLIYLHHRGIAHFDVKPQNLLRDAKGDVVLADFGVSELMLSDSNNLVACSGMGTPAFMAPEIAAGEALVDGEAVDVWALGVTAFVLLYGVLPFVGDTVASTFAAIRSVRYECPNTATSTQRDFFDKIFVLQPDRRWKLRQLRQHEMLCGNLSQSQRMSCSMSVARYDMDLLAELPTRVDASLISAEAACVSDSPVAPIPPTVKPQSFAGHRGLFSVTQAEMDSAISRLVSPVSVESDREVLSAGMAAASVSVSRSRSTSESTPSGPFSPQRQSPVPSASRILLHGLCIPPPMVTSCPPSSTDSGSSNPRHQIFQRHMVQPTPTITSQLSPSPESLSSSKAVHRGGSSSSSSLWPASMASSDHRLSRRETQAPLDLEITTSSSAPVSDETNSSAAPRGTSLSTLS